MQQHLPFTVLKHKMVKWVLCGIPCNVATAPTVYGIETSNDSENVSKNIFLVATAPTVYGIETQPITTIINFFCCCVATAPTVYGIETP